MALLLLDYQVPAPLGVDSYSMDSCVTALLDSIMLLSLFIRNNPPRRKRGFLLFWGETFHSRLRCKDSF